MGNPIDIILARRVNVFRAVAVRRRLVVACVIEAACVCALFVGLFSSRNTPDPALVLSLFTACVCAHFWSAIETVLLQRAMREPRGVWVVTFLGMLFAPAAPILVAVLLWESIVVVRIARRMRKDLCAKCEYDVRGIRSDVCPECGTPLFAST